MSFHQQIYDRLIFCGLSECGALGLLGNWECESNCEPYRVQGDFQPSRAISKAYVQSIESHGMTRDQFSRDQKGYGLAQWTYPSRKANLYDFWVLRSDSIASVDLQVDFAMSELRGEYYSLLTFLCGTDQIWAACERVCKEYERPAVNNVQARYDAALRIRQEINLDGSTTPDVTPADPIPTSEFWPPRTICNGMKGSDVEVLEALLKARGYNLHYISGIFGELLTEQTKLFQRDHKLDVDGIVGPLTWTELLKK